MKSILILVFTFIAQIAFADSFTLVRDGKEYLCTQTGPVDPGAEAKCVDKAYSGPFSKDESIRICKGARSNAPAECGINAYAGPFTKDEAVSLCIGAELGNGPSDCAAKAYAGPFSKSESIQLCQKGTVANAECAIKAYAGPYSKEEAIRLCSAQPQLVMRSLELLEKSTDIQSEVRKFRK